MDLVCYWVRFVIFGIGSGVESGSAFSLNRAQKRHALADDVKKQIRENLNVMLLQKTSNEITAGVILAAGMSRRFKSPKQLLKVGGDFMINRVIDAALKSRLETVILVLGHCFAEALAAIGSRIDSPRLAVAFNPDYKEGLSGSLRAGFQALEGGPWSSIMFLHGDQPMLDSAVINDMLTKFSGSKKKICIPVCGGEPKTPVIISKAFFPEFSRIKGDIGARRIIRANAAKTLEIEMNDPLPFFDIDTREDVERLESLIDAARPKAF